MNSVSSVGGSSQNSTAIGRSGGPSKQIDKELTKFLDSKGVSASDQEKIKGELQRSIESSIGSGGFPNPSKIRETIQGVFDKHGLNGEEFASKLPSFSGGPSSGLSAKGNSETDSIQSLLDFLSERAEDSKKRSSKSADSTEQQPTRGSDSSLNSQKPYTAPGSGGLDLEA